MAIWHKIASTAAITAALAASSYTYADHSEDFERSPRGDIEAGGERGDLEKRLKRLAKKLDLTEAQQQQLKQKMEADRDAGNKRHQAIMAARKALRDAGERGAPDAELKQLADSYGDLMAEQAMARVHRQRAMNEILTPEQREKWAELEKKMRERHARKDKNRHHRD